MNHVIVVDLGYGDAGKGGVVDWLCARPGTRPYRTVIRFNGGAQAAHNVITPDDRHHTFSQFGSGTLVPGVRTHLSRHMIVDPLALAAEAAHLHALGAGDVLRRLTVDRDALLATPYHQAANRARELARGRDRHGSCGMGVGEAASYALRCPADAPRAGDCAAPRLLLRKLAALRDCLTGELGPLDAPDPGAVCDAYRAFGGMVRLTDARYAIELLRSEPVVFEGAQGVLLDEWRGFHPYTTWSTTTFSNAAGLLAEAGVTATRLGVVRCYMTRHGPGPFVTEDPGLDVPEPHNGNGRWQGPVRTGHFDAVALRYAVEVAGGVDALAVTHLDVAARRDLLLCDAYEIGGQQVARLVPGPSGDLGYQEKLTRALSEARPVYRSPDASWPEVAERALGAPVTLLSYGAERQTKRATTRSGWPPDPAADVSRRRLLPRHSAVAGPA